MSSHIVMDHKNRKRSHVIIRSNHLIIQILIKIERDLQTKDFSVDDILVRLERLRHLLKGVYYLMFFEGIICNRIGTILQQYKKNFTDALSMHYKEFQIAQATNNTKGQGSIIYT